MNSRKKSILILICLALVLLIVAAFWPLKDSKFSTYDDDIYVKKNYFVQSGLNWNSIKWAFSSESVMRGGNWNPIIWLSLISDYEIFGLNATGYHLVNLFFHLLNTIFLFLILSGITKEIWKSAFVAALFAIHPTHVESVAWIAERKDVLSTLFFMMTIGAYVFYTEYKSVGRYILTLLFFVLGLMSKTMLVTLPFVLILLDYWPLKRLQFSSPVNIIWLQIRKILFEKIPFLILSMVFSCIAIISQKKGGGLDLHNPLMIRVSNAIRSYIIYLYKTAWPSDLAFFYPYPAILPFWQILGSAIILVGITFYVLWRVNKHPYLLVGWLWYLVTLLPVIGIIQTGLQAYADRYLYIPLIGIFMMCTWEISGLRVSSPYRKTILSLFTFILLGTLVMITRIQTSYWRDILTLSTHAAQVTQNNYVAYTGKGIALMEKGDIREAEGNFREAIRLNNNYSPAHTAYVKLLRREGRTIEALEHANAAIRIDPNDAEANNNLGNVLSDLKRYDEAMEAYKKVLDVAPDFAETYNNMGALMFIQGRNKEALDYYDKALQINPGLLETRYNLALILTLDGKFEEAKGHLQNIIRFRPDLYQAHYLLGRIAAAKGKHDEAIMHYQNALRIRPDFEQAKNDLNSILTNRGSTP